MTYQEINEIKIGSLLKTYSDYEEDSGFFIVLEFRYQPFFRIKCKKMSSHNEIVEFDMSLLRNGNRFGFKVKKVA